MFAMVCGSLPFDDDSMSALFQKIRDSKFYMPNFISDEVKDLINRMLQPNPVKRITIKEIRDHPWYARDLPSYIRDIQRVTIAKKLSNGGEIDMDIFKKMMSVSFIPYSNCIWVSLI